MDEFKVRSYTKKELALFYFPDASPHTAVNRLMRWINRNAPLLVGLEGLGYCKTARWFTSREVRLIVEHLVSLESRKRWRRCPRGARCVWERISGSRGCRNFAL